MNVFLSYRKHKSAFTIVELLIVIVVIGILAAISIIAYNSVLRSAAKATLQSDLRNAGTRLEIARVKDRSYPNPSLPGDFEKSDGTTLQYSATPSSYCLTATSGRNNVPAYHISSVNQAVTEGACSGHASGGGSGLTPPSTSAGEFVLVPGNATYGTSDFYVAKYEARNVSNKAVSQATGTPWVNINQTTAISRASEACDGCQLITEAQWMTIAMNVLSVPSNWSGGAVGSGTFPRGNSNSSAATDATSDLSGINKRALTLTNGEVIWDMAGNVAEWTQGTITGGQPGLSGQSGYVWNDYSNAGLQWNSLPTTSRPTGTLYPRSAGVGGVYGNPGETRIRAFLRSGNWGDGTGAGILTLYLYDSPSSSYAGFGFRVTR